jgi:hypothetical protein
MISKDPDFGSRYHLTSEDIQKAEDAARGFYARCVKTAAHTRHRAATLAKDLEALAADLRNKPTLIALECYEDGAILGYAALAAVVEDICNADDEMLRAEEHARTLGVVVP